MNNQTSYKRVKINWWIIILFGGFHVWMIFAYIHQWGNNPLNKSGFIIMSIIWFFVYIFLGRFEVIIDDNYAVFRSDVWVPVIIPIAMIKNVSIKRFGLMEFPENNIVKYQFNFVRQAVSIKLKRILITNNITSVS